MEVSPSVISASVLALLMIPTIIEREMVMVKVGEAIFIFIVKFKLLYIYQSFLAVEI